MKSTSRRALRLSRARREFLQDTWAGLAARPKRLSCKYFYDQRGSELFDQICLLEEYYPTRCELAIMDRFAVGMGRQIGPQVMLVEYGSGSSVKTRYLLDALQRPVAYVPVDISGEHLNHTAAELARDYPELEVLPVCADFTTGFELPTPAGQVSHVAVYFPGSTIGNLLPGLATALLGKIARQCGPGGGLLIGIDLKKDVSKIEAAYNDAEGVTAEFNLNLLRRINRELGGDFDLSQFRHHAHYDAQFGRIEMQLVSCRQQLVTIAGRQFKFAAGESISTEYSHKYTIDEFAAIAAPTGFVLHHQWTDAERNFAVLHLVLE